MATYVNIDLASIVLDKCIIRTEEDNNGTPCTTHMLYNYEFIDDFDEPQLSRLGNFLLKTVLHYKSQKREIPLVTVNHSLENGDLNLFMSTDCTVPTKQAHVIQSARRHTVMRSARRPAIIPSTQNWGPKVYDKNNHIMTLMVRIIIAVFIDKDIDSEVIYIHIYHFSIEGGT